MLIQSLSEHTIFRLVAMLALMSVLALSFLPSESVDPLRLHIAYSIDIAHVVAYAALAGASMLSMHRQSRTPWRGAAITSAISLLGIAIELLQPLAGRTASIVDFAGNEAGIVLGTAAACAYLLIDKVRNNNLRLGGRRAAKLGRNLVECDHIG